MPVGFGWHAVFSRMPGKLATIGYFAMLGLGYIPVEVGLISRFTLALSNPTISASILISAKLLFSGLGSLVSERIVDRARIGLPVILAAIAILLSSYFAFFEPVLDRIGGYPFPMRLPLSFLLGSGPINLVEVA